MATIAEFMYPYLLFFHSLFRWLVLAGLLYTLFRAFRGYTAGNAFTKADNASRHWTATLAHIQLLIGFTLYIKSPVTAAFFASFSESIRHLNTAFFGVIHSSLMLVSIVLITIGSALAKRQLTDREKFRTMLVWFSLALVLIFLAIPWPFSPFANRPYIRHVYP